MKKSANYLYVLLAAMSILALTGCSDTPLGLTAPAQNRLSAHSSVSVCHMSAGAGTVMSIPGPALAGHMRHGDYVAELLVDKATTSAGDAIHFTRIGDAIAAARATRIARNELLTGACRITIKVAPGIYQGSVSASADPAFEQLPLVIDIPDVTLAGSLVMQLDDEGRPTGPEVGGAEGNSTLVATPGLVSIRTGSVLDKYAEPLIVVNSHPDGSHGDGVVIQGFWFQSGNEAPDAIVGGNAVWAMRARLVVRGNLIGGGFAEPVEFRASAGTVANNLLTGRGGSCALCMFGPGSYEVTSNRQTGLANRLAVLVFPAIFAAIPPGVEQFTPPAEALVTAIIRNNDFRDHQEVPFGIGVRIAAIGPGAPNVAGTARVAVISNNLSNNRFAIVAEAGFPVANTALRGDIDLTVADNILNGSCQAPMLIALNSQASAVGLQSGPSLRNSTFTVSLDGNFAWSAAWYSHPAGAGNTLTVDGNAVATGKLAPYDAAKACAI